LPPLDHGRAKRPNIHPCVVEKMKKKKKKKKRGGKKKGICYTHAISSLLFSSVAAFRRMEPGVGEKKKKGAELIVVCSVSTGHGISNVQHPRCDVTGTGGRGGRKRGKRRRETRVFT